MLNFVLSSASKVGVYGCIRDCFDRNLAKWRWVTEESGSLGTGKTPRARTQDIVEYHCNLFIMPCPWLVIYLSTGGKFFQWNNSFKRYTVCSSWTHRWDQETCNIWVVYWIMYRWYLSLIQCVHFLASNSCRFSAQFALWYYTYHNRAIGYDIFWSKLQFFDGKLSEGDA